jgi:thiamine-monophosphate kinase
LLQEGVRTAIDISDGLVADLTHICRTSRVGARVDIDRVPVAPAVIANFGNKALELALSGGEDYELLFTASSETIDKVKRAVKCPITVIGDIIASDIMGVTLVDSEGKPFQLTKGGWEHFTA